MEWPLAIEKSKKGTATRITEYDNGLKKIIIRYKDCSGFTLFSNNGKIDYFLSRPAQGFEMNGFKDWQPS